MKLAEVIGIGIWKGILKTLQGRYFRSMGSPRHYFYFPSTNIEDPKELNFGEQIKIYSFTNIGDIQLRVIEYRDDVFNPSKIMSVISLKDLFLDYEEISKDLFISKTKPIQDAIDKYN